MREAPIHKALPIVAQAVGDKHGLTVQVGGDNACTNGQVIMIPSLPEGDAARILARGFIDHEAAHVRCTNFKVAMDHLTNALEDIRIEGEIGQIYPGSKKNLKDLANHLAQEGILRVTGQEAAVDVFGKYANLTLRRDRLNQDLLGQAEEIERVMEARYGNKVHKQVDKILAGEIKSTGDAKQRARELYKLLKQQEEQSQQGQSQQSDQSDQADGSDSSGQSGQDSQSSDEAEESSGEESGQSGSDTEEGSDEGQDGQDGQSSSDSRDGQDDDDEDASGQAGQDGDEEDDSDQSGSGSSASSEDADDSGEQSDAGDGQGSQSQGDAGDENSSGDQAGGAGQSGTDTDQNGSDQAQAGNGSGGQDAGSDYNPDEEGEFEGLGEMLREVLDALAQEKPTAPMAQMMATPRDTVSVPSEHLRFDVGAAKQESAKLRKKLKGLLEAQRRDAEYVTRSGRQFAKKDLHRLATKDTRVFSRRVERNAPNTAIHVLMDTSGSMSSGGANYLIRALEAGYAIGCALDKIPHVQYAISSFPGVGGDVLGVERVKRFDEGSLRASRFGLDAKGTTPTPQAMWYAASTLAFRKEERKLVFVVTDGKPDDPETTISLDRRLRRQGIEVLGIGIMCPHVEDIFQEHLMVNSLGELAPTLFKALERKL